MHTIIRDVRAGSKVELYQALPFPPALSQRAGGTLNCAPSADAVAGRGREKSVGSGQEIKGSEDINASSFG